MKLSEYQKSRSFFDLGQSHSDFKVKCLTFGLYTQVSDSGPQGLLFLHLHCMTARHLDFFVTALKCRLLTTDVTFSISCELSQPIGNTKCSSTAKK